LGDGKDRECGEDTEVEDPGPRNGEGEISCACREVLQEFPRRETKWLVEWSMNHSLYASSSFNDGFCHGSTVRIQNLQQTSRDL
jgi:hypothetical protein